MFVVVVGAKMTPENPRNFVIKKILHTTKIMLKIFMTMMICFKNRFCFICILSFWALKVQNIEWNFISSEVFQNFISILKLSI